MRKLVLHLVDDNDIDIAVNTKLLQLAQIGDETVTYNSGVLFLEKLEKERATFIEQDNVVLMDIMMPGLTGFETMLKFAELDEETKSAFNVFMLSSSIDRNDIRKAEGTPYVHRILEKPLDVYLLKKLLEEL
ncbi:MAG: response regulator [Flavobacteriales bacterium]